MPKSLPNLSVKYIFFICLSIAICLTMEKMRGKNMLQKKNADNKNSNSVTKKIW